MINLHHFTVCPEDSGLCDTPVMRVSFQGRDIQAFTWKFQIMASVDTHRLAENVSFHTLEEQQELQHARDNLI